MAKDILVLLETRAGNVKKTSFELLSEAYRLAKELDGNLKALFIGQGIKAQVSALGEYGVVEAFVADHGDLKDYSIERYTSLVAESCKKSDAAVLMATASSMGRDLLPRVAARLNTGMITECVSLSVQDGKVVGQRPIYAGKCLVEVTIPKSTPQVITCRPNVFETKKAETPTTPKVTEFGTESVLSSVKAKIVEVVQAKSDKPDLTEAPIIVSAGRSIKSGDNFKMIHELADVLGAAVGASRAAVDAGYAPHSMQVGQTGKTVNPKLYIACGISGAIQHLAGMRTSKVIVAINSDPQAPIFQKADYGIVGDLFEIVPKMTEAFQKLLKE